RVHAGRCGEEYPALQAGEALAPHRPGDMGLGPLQPGRMLGRVQPGPQVGERVKAVDDPVLAAAAGGGAEDLDTEIAGKRPGRAADAGQEPLISRRAAWRHPA